MSARAVWAPAWTADARSLTALRIGLGIALLVDLSGRAADLRAHYTDDGVLPSAALGPMGRFAFPFHRLSGDAPAQALLFVVAGIAAVALLVGFRTRLANLTSWLLLVSLHDRNPLVLEGGDGLLRILLFFGLFFPLDAAFSLDARRRKALVPRAITGPAVLAMHVQIACMYLFAALLKARSPYWQDGSALGHALAGYHLTTEIGNLVFAHPTLARVLSRGALLIELVGPLLLLWPARSCAPRVVGLMGLAGLQIGIATCMNIGNFQPMALLWTVPMIPGCLWDRLGFAAPKGDVVMAPALASSPRLGLAGRVAPLALMAYVVAVNVESLFVPHDASTRFDRLAFALGLDQRWDMFSMPAVAGRATGWTVLAARLHDGREVDLQRGGAPLSWDKPSRPSEIYGGFRWRSFTLWSIWFSTSHRASYGAYACRAWNRSHAGGDRAEALAIVWMRQRADASGALGRVERVVLWDGRCGRSSLTSQDRPQAEPSRRP